MSDKLLSKLDEEKLKIALHEGVHIDPFFALPNEPKQTILEISAGMGNAVSVPLALQGHDVIATEASRTMMDIMKKVSKKYGAHLKIRKFDFNHPPPPRGKFDRVFARWCLHFHNSMKHLGKTLTLLQDITAEGGEHRFKLLSNQQYKDGRQWSCAPNMSGLDCSDYEELLKRIYNDWNCSFEVEKDLRGSFISEYGAKESKYNSILFTASRRL